MTPARIFQRQTLIDHEIKGQLQAVLSANIKNFISHYQHHVKPYEQKLLGALGDFPCRVVDAGSCFAVHHLFPFWQTEEQKYGYC